MNLSTHSLASVDPVARPGQTLGHALFAGGVGLSFTPDAPHVAAPANPVAAVSFPGIAASAKAGVAVLVPFSDMPDRLELLCLISRCVSELSGVIWTADRATVAHLRRVVDGHFAALEELSPTKKIQGVPPCAKT